MKSQYIKYDLTKPENTEVYRHTDIKQVPSADQWAFNHIMHHDCESICTGLTIYQIQTNEK